MKDNASTLGSVKVPAKYARHRFDLRFVEGPSMSDPVPNMKDAVQTHFGAKYEGQNFDQLLPAYVSPNRKAVHQFWGQRWGDSEI